MTNVSFLPSVSVGQGCGSVLRAGATNAFEDESLAPSHLSFQPNHTERLETDLGLGESLGTEFEPNS
jgi:hypothetical protein